MSLRHRLTGYSKRTEFLEFAFVVPAEHERRVVQAMGFPASDPGGEGGYPLSPALARSVGEMVGAAPINVDAYDWFLEPVPAPLHRAVA